jgi:transposase InsO family protein
MDGPKCVTQIRIDRPVPGGLVDRETSFLGWRRGHSTLPRSNMAPGEQAVEEANRHMSCASDPSGIGENLLDRQFDVDTPNRVWVADTTYLSISDGPAFLVAIQDLFSRCIVGWAVGPHLDAKFARRAPAKALAVRQPSTGLLFHSDRGGEFTGTAFGKDLALGAATSSLCRPGECYDNVPAESQGSQLRGETRRQLEERTENGDSGKHLLSRFTPKLRSQAHWSPSSCTSCTRHFGWC